MTTCACTEVGTAWAGTPTGADITVPTTTTPPLPAYLAVPPGDSGDAAAAAPVRGVILFITDIFGIHRPNPRLWCDRLAAKGFAVVAPDFFRGGAFPADKPLTAEAFMPWLAQFPRDSVLADAAGAIEWAKQQYPGVPVSAVGFCWGGQYVALLGGGAAPSIAAGAMLHPSLITPDDVKGISVPVFVGTNGEDQQVSDEFRAEIHAVLAGKPFPTATQHWEAMRHGWSLRGDDTDPVIAAAAQEAFDRASGWLEVHGMKE